MSAKPKKPADKTDIKSLMGELEAIVSWFERDDIDISEALDKYEEGLEKIQAIEKQLEAAKVKVEKIEKRFDV